MIHTQNNTLSLSCKIFCEVLSWYRFFCFLLCCHSDMWLDILLYDFMVENKLHGSLNYIDILVLRSSKAFPDHCTTTSMFNSWCDVLFQKSYFGRTHTQTNPLLFQQSKGHFPKSPGHYQDVLDFSGKIWNGSLCYFYTLVIFVLELFRGCCFY